MKILNHIYQFINIISIDVVAGSVISSLFFAKIFNVAVSPYVLGALALTVWIIYTIDHLRDATLIPKLASTDRHRFHQIHFTTILIILVFAILLDLVMVWYIPDRILTLGFVLGLWVMIYLVFQRYLRFLKEVFVAYLYTGGILLPSLAMEQWEGQPAHYFFIMVFCVTALINLLLFSLFDYEHDRSHRQQSFVTWFGPGYTRKGILFLGLLNILICAGLWSFNFQVAIIFILMNMMLMAILLFQKHFVANNYYRIMGDAVFFIPIFYLL